VCLRRVLSYSNKHWGLRVKENCRRVEKATPARCGADARAKVYFVHPKVQGVDECVAYFYLRCISDTGGQNKGGSAECNPAGYFERGPLARMLRLARGRPPPLLQQWNALVFKCLIWCARLGIVLSPEQKNELKKFRSMALSTWLRWETEKEICLHGAKIGHECECISRVWEKGE
jgi:hypothetical protein